MSDTPKRVALVTGGSRGIGRSVAELLARRGATVVVNYASRADAAETVCEAIRSAGGQAEPLKFDVSNGPEVTAAIEGIVSKFGRLDILVASAGVAIDQLLVRLKDADLHTTLSTNLAGALYCARAGIRPMLKQKWGRVVFLSSVVGQTGNAGQVAYAASKAGLEAAAKSLAREYGSRGITFNAVAPGFIETDMTSGLTEAQRAAMIAATPVGRMGTPEEVAAAIAFLCSEEAAFITGETLSVNGGMWMG